MKTKAVIFDKDGTLMDFDSFWLTISHAAVPEILEAVHAGNVSENELLEAMGVHDQVTDIDGVLCYGTYEEMGDVMYAVLKGHGCDCTPEQLHRLTVQTYRANAHVGNIRPACADIHSVLNRLKEKGILLAVVTTDDPVVTGKCLDALEITSYFAEVYTNDGILPPKPDPYCIRDFCARYGFTPDEIVMVGDTMTDIRFALNGGVRAIGVAKSDRSREILQASADVVVPDISYVLDILE